MKIKNGGILPRFTDLIVLLSLLLSGAFHEFVCCLLSAIMSIWLLFRLRKNGKFRLRKNLISYAFMMIPLAYGITCLWGVDKGMAFIGFLKFCPLGMYLLCLWQEEGESRLEELLPIFGTITTILSAIFMFLPGLKVYFSVAGRLSGFFQYPNTYALFALICQLFLLKKTSRTLWDYCMMAVLIGGLLYSGSRTVLVLALLSNIAMILASSQKKTRLFLLAGLSFVAVTAAVLALIGVPVISRYLSISVFESTFIGRLLYLQDALPLVLTHPFGLGYYGYFYTQSSVQTGIYSVAFIHNELFQLLLDIGWLPTLLLLIAVIKWLTNKSVALTNKIIVGTMLLHCLFDFDLQYLSMFLLLSFFLYDPTSGTAKTYSKTGFAKAAICAIGILSLYIAIPLSLSSFGAYRAAESTCSFNTSNKILLLERTDSLAESQRLADDILAQNTESYIPYTVKALGAYSRGDIMSVMENSRTVIEKAPLRYESYDKYCQMLINIIQQYRANGDTESAQYCETELLAVVSQFEAMPNSLSFLGKRIKDQPNTQLSEYVQQYLSQLNK